MKLSVGRVKEKVEEWGVERCLIVLLAIVGIIGGGQIVRYGVTRIGAYALVRSLEASGRAPSARKAPEELGEYEVILEKGLLGSPPKKETPKLNLFGVLGATAFIGTSSGDAKPYEVGAEVPGGGKLVKIGTSEVVLEADGKEQVVKVFPDLPGMPGKPDPKKSEGEAPGPVVADGADERVDKDKMEDTKPGTGDGPKNARGKTSGGERKPPEAEAIQRLRAMSVSK